MSDHLDAIEIKEREVAYFDAGNKITTLLDELPLLLRPITAEDPVDVESLEGTLRLVRDFISNDVVKRTYTHAPLALRGRQPVNDTFLRNVRLRPDDIRKVLHSQERLKSVSGYTDHLKRALKEALERSKRKEHAFLTVPEQTELESIVETIADRLSNLDKNYELKAATVRASLAAASAEASAVKASSAAGVTADTVMSEFYESLGGEELETANAFRDWAIRLGVIAGIFACLFLFGEGIGADWLTTKPGDYVPVLQRALVLGALLALATYLAKQSHQHRTMSNWARSLAVQLKTFDAFMDAVDDARVRDELRKNFAIRVFGDHPAVKGEPAFTASSQSVAALTDTVTKLLPAAK